MSQWPRWNTWRSTEKSFCYVYKVASPCTTFQGSVQSHLLCTWSRCPCPCSLPDWARARCLLSPRFYPLCRPWPAGECWGSILWPLLSWALGISQHQTQVVLKLWFFATLPSLGWSQQLPTQLMLKTGAGVDMIVFQEWFFSQVKRQP